MAKIFNRAIKLCGEPLIIGVSNTGITVLEYDSDGNVMRAKGAIVPTSGDAGYSKGCQFIKTDAATGVKSLYENQGTTDSVSFNVIGDITTAEIADAAVTKTKLSYEVVAVTVAAAATSGTGTATTGSIILGYYPTGNQDQLVDNVAIAGTTVTVTLAAAATANNTFNVVLLKA